MANQREINIVVKAREEASKTVESMSGRIKKSLGDVTKIAAGFLAAQAITTGFRTFVDGINSSIEAASSLGESINAIQVTFGEASGKLLDFGKQAAESAGLSQRAFNELATPLGAILQNFGFSADEAADQTINLTQRAADMASVFNTDVSDALGAIQAALRGEANPIERYGVSVNAAAVEARALADTGKDTAKALTEQEKATARLALIMEQTAKVQGDFANTSDGLANRQRVLSARIENLQARFGAFAAEFKAKVLGLILDVGLPAFEKFGNAVGDLAEIVEPVVSKIASAVKESFGIIGDILGENNDHVYALAKIVGDDLAFAIYDVINFIIRDAIPALKEMGEKIITFAQNVAVIVSGFIQWYRNSGLAAAALEGIKVVAQGLMEVLKVLGKAIGEVIDFLSENETAAKLVAVALVAIVVALAPIPAAILAVVTVIGLLSKNWDEIKAKAEEIWENAIPGIFKEALEFIARDVKEKFEGIVQVFKSSFDLIKDTFEFWKAVFTGDWKGAWENLKQIVQDILNIMTGAFSAAFGAVPGLILSAASAAASEALNFGKAIINGIADGISSGVSAVAAKGAEIGNAIINAVKNALRNFTIPISISVNGPLPGDVDKIEWNTTLRPFAFLRSGHPYIPYDNYPAMLHRGEAVLTADENRERITPGLLGSGLNVNIASMTIQDPRRDDGPVGDLAWSIVTALRSRGM